MVRHLIPVLLAACLGCGASQATSLDKAPPEAQVEEPVAASPAGSISLSQMPELTRIDVPCASAEPDVPNGIDDDCDGRIDGDPNALTTGFTLSISWQAGSDLNPLLTHASGEPVAPTDWHDHAVCESGASFSTARASFGSLAAGRYELVVLRGDRCTKPSAPEQVSVSAWNGSTSLGTYAGSLKPSERERLFVIDVR